MKLKRFLMYFFTFLTFVIFCYPLFLKKTFGPVSFEQFLFHLVNPIKGTDPRLYYKGIGYVVILPLLLTIAYLTPHVFLKKFFKKYSAAWESSRWRSILIVPLFIAACAFQIYVLRIDQWYMGHRNPSILFRDFYVGQTANDITFSKKKNAIVVFMESMEETYGNFSIFKKNYIPELMTLEKENTSFDRFYQMPGTQWTMAGVFSSMCGAPLRIPLRGSRLDMFKTFLPSIVCIPQILQAHGYQTGFILGSNAVFSGMDNFASQHGFDQYWGIAEIEKELGGLKDDMYGHGWGLNDVTMFDFAKSKIVEASKKDKPFFYVLSTIDTHFPNGYFDPRHCQHEENNGTDVIRCSSRLIHSFVNWVQAQPFAKDTAIILVGDHLSMANDVYDTLIKSQNRQIVDIFINGTKTPHQKEGRAFATFDFAPSILSFMGGNIPQDAFGLGRDLFSKTPTITEKLGVSEIRNELQKYPPEYQKFFKPVQK